MLLQSLVHPVRTMEQLNKQRESNLFTDITILVAGEKFCAHRALLAAHSPVFKRVLEDSSFAQENPNINLDGVEPMYFGILLDFLYTSKLAIDLTNVDQVSTASKFLQVSSVVELCTKFKEANKKLESVKESTHDDGIVQGSSSDDLHLINSVENDHDLNAQNNQFVKCEQIEIQVTDEGQAVVQNETDNSLSPFEVPLANVTESVNGFEKSQRKRGRKLVTRVECPVCHKVMTQARLVSHIRSHTGEKTVKCNICGKAFANIYNLKIHARKHTGEKPYKCPLCPRVYSDPSSLCKHKLWHAGIKKKKCGVCGRLFSTMSQVTEHMRTHTKERPFFCRLCEKTFSYKCDLTRHMREHTGDLLGPCKYCGKRFTHQGNYKAHLRVHESRKTEKVRLGSETFVISENGSNNAVTLTSQSADIDNETPERAIVKVSDLAELMVQGHEIEVMINDGKLVVKQPIKEGDGISLQHGENDEVISVESDVINVESDVMSTQNDGQLVIVDQIIEPTYSGS